MRSNTATTRRVRLVIVLSVAAAVTVMIGAIMVVASLVMRRVTSHQPAHMARLGLDVAAAGIAFGLVVLVVFAIARIGGAGRSRPRAGAADHRRGAGRPEPAAASPGHGRSPGHGKDRLRAGAPPAGGGHAGREGGARSSRPHVLKPTNVYTPGGLIDMPGDGRAPGTPGGESIPEILRTAGPGPVPGAPPGGPGPVPGAPGGRSQDRPSPGWPGPQPPRPGYQPGMNPAGPGRAPYAPGGQPVPPMPPRDHSRPREAPRSGHAMPGRDGMPGREPMPPRGAAPPQKPQAPREAPRPGQAGPPRDAGLLRDAGPPRDAGMRRDAGPPREGMPRDGMGPGGPPRPGGPLPPRDPAYQPPPGQGQGPPPGQGHGPDRGAGRHAGGPGYAVPGGRRPGAPGHAGTPVHAGVPGSAGPAEAAGQFDGGYAYVIRASDNPVRPPGPARPPSFGRPADPARSQASRPAAETPADVYVYRDTSGQPDDPAAGGPGEGDAAYWYDLPGTGSGDDAPPRVAEETRGPFEPLVSSADPPGTTLRFSPSPDAASTGTAEPVVPPDEAPRAEGQEETAHAHARKLEQIKDLYLTAEAIGEANVDKHFDHLLAQQRELISDYFKHSNAARPAAAGSPAAGDPAAVADSADQAETDPGAARDPGSPIGGPAGAPGSARVAADQPRVW